MSKLFLLFIVEGINDSKEIGAILHSPYFKEELKKYQPWFIEVHGDITTSKGTSVNNVQQRINEIVLKFRRDLGPYRNIKVQDIHEIVHIVDLDGVFIPPSSIVRGDTSDLIYTDSSIITSNIDGAKGRNKKKAEILEKLVRVNQIGNIPYSIYFFSRNMEHVLFNNADVLSVSEKRILADHFREECSSKAEILEDSLFKEGVKTEKDFYESWKEAHIGFCSLHRRTNFNVFFSDCAKNKR